MTVGGQQIEEDMEMHESEEFLKIQRPATKKNSAVTIIHHFGQVRLDILFFIPLTYWCFEIIIIEMLRVS